MRPTTRSMTRKSMKVHQDPLVSPVVLHLDTEDEEEADPSATVEALVNLKETKTLDHVNSTTYVSFEALKSENVLLKNELHEYVVLERFLKDENITLKIRFHN